MPIQTSRMYLIAIAALIIAAAPLALIAKTPPTTQPLELQTHRVVIFKDGYGLFIKKATGQTDAQGRLFTDEVPDAAVLGSIWATSENHPIVAMRAEHVEQWTTKTASLPTTLGDLLARAKDKPVLLTLSNGDQLRGTFVGNLANSVVMLLTEDGQVRLVKPNEVKSIDGLSAAETAPTTRVSTPIKRLTFDLGEEAANQTVELTLMYFRPDVRWIPTYQLDLESDQSGQLSLQGEILNEAENLEDVAVDLVVGVPNFRFKNVVSPLILEASLRHALTQAAPNIMGMRGQLNNAMFTQRAGEFHGRPIAPPHGPATAAPLPNELAGAGEHDLFIYTAEHFSLKRGGRASLPLRRRDVPIQHLYTMNVHLMRKADGGFNHAASQSGAGESPLKLLNNPIWHQLELTNQTGSPWTTGAVMLLRGHLPLAQELLTYTPINGKALVPITVAVDLRGRTEEREIDRKINALHHNSHAYTLIRKKGVVTLINYRKEKATMRIALSMGGRVEKVSDEGVIKLDDYRQSDWPDSRAQYMNPHSDIAWELELAPGETRELTYECSYYKYAG